jgi:hypothetical protein
VQLAPLEVVAEKLEARSPQVRAVAVIHAAGHGAAARGLATQLVRMLADVEEVAFHAMHALRAIGPGANEVPALLELLQRGGDARLVRRVLFLLGLVGPPARAALKAIERLAKGPDAADAISAMAAIAPEDPDVVELVAESIVRRPVMFAAREPPPAAAIDRAVELMAAPGAKPDALPWLARWRPERIAPLLVERMRASKPNLQVMNAIRALPPPHPEPLRALVLASLAAGDPLVEERALELLDPSLTELSPVRRLLEQHEHGPAIAGPEGAGARVFAKAALALSARGQLTGAEHERVRAWLDRVVQLKPGVDKPSWYTVRVAVEAIAAVPDGWARVVAVTRAAQSFMDHDESGVLDFHRTLRKLVRTDAQRAELRGLGVPDRDPYDDDRQPADDAPPPADYPEFPPDEEPTPGRFAPLRSAPDLRDDFARGVALLDATAQTPAAELVSLLQRYLQRHRREQRPPPEPPAIAALAAVWAHCLISGLGWEWKIYSRGTEYSTVVASTERGEMFFPQQWVTRQFQKRDITAELTFNMCRERPAHAHPEPVALW